jgi:Asp-tRNA(Asn)/Glu-tRNA(Gln) amidotransferase A subunit family amidase
VAAAAGWLAAAGATVVADRPEGLERRLPADAHVLVAAGVRRRRRWEPGASTDLDGEAVQRFRFEWDGFRRRMARFMGSYDAVLTPAAELPAVLHGEPTRVDRAHAHLQPDGQPAAVVPCGRDDDGLPIGVQVAARVGATTCPRLAAALEAAGGGWWRPPGRVGLSRGRQVRVSFGGARGVDAR